MDGVQSPVSPDEFKIHVPVLENMADEICERISDMSPAQLSEILGISNGLAIKTKSLAYDFPHKLTGYEALYGFTGEAYRGLKAKSLTKKALDKAETELRIISSVYGILKPFDIIKPYRCEFNRPIAPDNKTPIQFFKSKITIELVNFIKENKIDDIIDLLPGDADKCIDWKIVRAFSNVNKICFQTITAEGKLKTPIASRLKDLRGKMARFILEEDIQSFKDLTAVATEDFIFSKADSKPGLPVFISK